MIELQIRKLLVQCHQTMSECGSATWITNDVNRCSQGLFSKTGEKYMVKKAHKPHKCAQAQEWNKKN